MSIIVTRLRTLTHIGVRFEPSVGWISVSYKKLRWVNRETDVGQTRNPVDNSTQLPVRLQQGSWFCKWNRSKLC